MGISKSPSYKIKGEPRGEKIFIETEIQGMLKKGASSSTTNTRRIFIQYIFSFKKIWRKSTGSEFETFEQFLTL